MLFCNEREDNPFSPLIDTVLTFLLALYNGLSGNKLGYSALNTARSAVSSVATVDNLPVGQHPLTKRFMKAVFNLRPALPKTVNTWDVDIVLEFLRRLQPVASICLLDLSRKLVTLLLLLSGQRGQIISLIDIRNISVTNSRLVIRIGDLTKTSRPNHHQQELSFLAYEPDVNLCVVHTYLQYIARTVGLRGNTTQLFITTRPPYKSVSRDTITRWTKTVLVDAGIDMSVFTPHSVRSASTSKAAEIIPLQTVLKTAGWTQQSTFTKYYKRDCCDKTFDTAILQGISD